MTITETLAPYRVTPNHVRVPYIWHCQVHGINFTYTGDVCGMTISGLSGLEEVKNLRQHQDCYRIFGGTPDPGFD